MANGQFDASVPSSATGTQFHSEIMGRSEAEAFFRDTYGIDFSQADAVDGVKTVDNATLDTPGFMVEPRIEYRAYTVAGRDVPAEGWVVRDGGWMVTIGDGGAVLKGTWGGGERVEVPAGSFLVFGDYNIDTGTEPILIHYESGSPILPMGPDGIMAFSCDLSSPEWGEGRGQRDGPHAGRAGGRYGPDELSERADLPAALAAQPTRPAGTDGGPASGAPVRAQSGSKA